MFIAVHVGAGCLSKNKEPKYRAACARACEVAMEILKAKGSAIDAVAAAIKILEDDACTNAGWGSNLTIAGTVECDAGLMEGQQGQFGAVGAVSGILNPIMTAKQMVVESKQGLLSLGRIPPMLLVGEGAKTWTASRGYPLVEGDFVEPSSYCVYQNHLQRVEEYDAEVNLGHDTVGAICIDSQGNLASGVSSGGISLKQPGRVGEAAMYGCGCWAQNETDTLPGVACSTSGTGEQIMKTMLTYKCAHRLLNDEDVEHAMRKTFEEDFLDSPFLHLYETKSVGIIALRTQTSHHKARIELWYGHTTDDMGIGYMSDTSKKPKTFISRKTSGDSLVKGQLIK